MSEKKIKLTARQKAFCDYYLKLGNATEACRKAGYKGKNLKTIASENLTKLNVKQYLEQRMSKMDKKRIASAEEVLEFLTRVMRGQEKDQFGLDLTMSDRLKAAESLGKRYRAFEKVDEKLEELKRRKLELENKKLEKELEGDTEQKDTTIKVELV